MEKHIVLKRERLNIINTNRKDCRQDHIFGIRSDKSNIKQGLFSLYYSYSMSPFLLVKTIMSSMEAGSE